LLIKDLYLKTEGSRKPYKEDRGKPYKDGSTNTLQRGKRD
jgi:hypothetical protein